jgi:hypothetical protein
MNHLSPIAALTLAAAFAVLTGCATPPANKPSAENTPVVPTTPAPVAEPPPATTPPPPAPRPEEEVRDLYTLPPASSKQCADYIESIVRRPEPLTEACISRYKSLTEESILCRLDIVQFLRQNSLGEGDGFATCGKSAQRNDT